MADRFPIMNPTSRIAMYCTQDVRVYQYDLHEYPLPIPIQTNADIEGNHQLRIIYRWPNTKNVNSPFCLGYMSVFMSTSNTVSLYCDLKIAIVIVKKSLFYIHAESFCTLS